MGKCQVYPGLSAFHISEKKIFLPSYLLALATRLCRFSISGWLSQAVKSTDANIKKIASGTLDTSQKLTCFLKTATCRCIHLRCRRISVFPLAIKLIVQEVLVHLSEYQLCDFIQLIITDTNVPVNVFFEVDIDSTICGSVSFHEIAFSMRERPRRVQTGQYCQQLLQLTSDFLAFASLAASALSPHCILKVSARCASFQLLPMISPSALVVPLVANTDANSLEVESEVSASKIPRMFSCRKSLLISEFEAFNA